MGSVTILFVAILLVALVLMGILSMWKRVPADKAAVVVGHRKKRVVSGGGTIVYPVIERMDIITLENICGLTRPTLIPFAVITRVTSPRVIMPVPICALSLIEYPHIFAPKAQPISFDNSAVTVSIAVKIISLPPSP